MVTVTGYRDAGRWYKLGMPRPMGALTSFSIPVGNLRLLVMTGSSQVQDWLTSIANLLLCVNVLSEAQLPYDQAHATVQWLAKKAAYG